MYQLHRDHRVVKIATEISNSKQLVDVLEILRMDPHHAYIGIDLKHRKTKHIVPVTSTTCCY